MNPDLLTSSCVSQMRAPSRLPARRLSAALRAALPVFAVLLAVALALGLSGCSSRQQRVAEGLRKSSDFVARDDLDRADVEVRNVLQIDPGNAAAYVLAGRIAQGRHDLPRAYAAYRRALEIDPASRAAHLGLARVALFGGLVDLARSELAGVLAADPGNVEARTLQAALMARSGQTDQALAQAQALVEGQAAPPVDASLLLAGLYSTRGQADRALAVVEQALQKRPADIGLLQVAAQISAGLPAGDPQGQLADGYFRRLTQAAPQRFEAWQAWAEHALRQGQVDAAEAVLRQAAQAAPDEGRRRLALLGFLAAQRGPVVAEAAYRAAIEAHPREMALRFGLADFYRGLGRSALAQGVLREIVDRSDDMASTLAAKDQLAAYRLSAGRPDEAGQWLAEVLKVSPRDNEALILRARIQLRAGRADDAVADLRNVARDQPGSPEVIGLLADAHRAAGDPRLAREVLDEAVKTQPGNAALHLLLAANLSQAQDLEGAKAQLDAAIRLAPDAAGGYDTRARLALARGDAAAAEQAFRAMRERPALRGLAEMRLGQLYASQGRYAQALAAYDAGQAAAPADPLPYLAGVGALVRLKRFDEAQARIDRAQAREPKNVVHLQLRGDVAMARGDTAAAERAYRAAIALAPTVPIGYLQTARLLGLRHDLPAALAVLAQGEHAAPGEVSIPLARADLLARAGRKDEAMAVYERLFEREPDNDDVANNLAFLLADARGDRASLERALSLVSRFADSTNAAYLDSLGWIQQKLGHSQQAVAVLDKAAGLAPQSALIQLHLGQALVKAGQSERGKVHLRRAVDSGLPLPQLDEARALLAQG